MMSPEFVFVTSYAVKLYDAVLHGVLNSRTDRNLAMNDIA